MFTMLSARRIGAGAAAIASALTMGGLSTSSAAAAPTQTQRAATTVQAGQTTTAVQTKQEKVLAFARAQIGKPYVFGGNGPNSYDCSGLTRASYRQVGVTLARHSTEQHLGYREVAASARRPGDLIWWTNVTHVAIYAGNGRLIEAASPRLGIREWNVYRFNGHPARYYRIVN